MLVRTFRLTDKLSNALLRLTVWFSLGMLSQARYLRLALISSIGTLWFTITQTVRSGQAVYQSTEQRRRAIMAHHAAESATRPIVREDPLKTQNRALSLFTALLMAFLILMVLWFTSSGQFNPAAPRVAANGLLGNGSNNSLVLQTRGAPTSFPTVNPTSTPIPDPLRTGGSIAYTKHENGNDHLWVLGIGQSTPIQLTNGTFDDRDPAWSPDGSKIAFASHRGGNWELYLIDVTTGNVTQLTYDLNYKAAPTWSPDGQFIAYEAYEENNLDIYIMPSDGSRNPLRLTHSIAPDYSPAWSPDGRRIAYVSLRDHNAEIYVISLDNPDENKALRLTNTPDINEESPVWSPDGQSIAYSARVNGLQMVFTKSLAQPQADPVTIGQGHQPAWSPNGASLLFAVDNSAGTSTTLVGAQVGTVGVSTLAIQVTAPVKTPRWTAALLPSSLVQSGGLRAAEAPPLFKEVVHYQAQTAPFNRLAALTGVTAPNPYLSDKVDDSFIGLRSAAVQQVGTDFLGTLKDALWSMDRIPDLGQTRQNWHFAGRAFDYDENLVFGDKPAVEVVREDVGVNTYWRTYIRVPESLQGGQLGEPLKQFPWDFASRSSGDPQAFENGGREKAAIPSGYYVDFTALAADYGWSAVPSERNWRSVYTSLLYWEYDKREGLAWNDAMLQLYSQEQIDTFLSGPTLVPTPFPQASSTLPVRGPTRTPTPIPPDTVG